MRGSWKKSSEEMKRFVRQTWPPRRETRRKSPSLVSRSWQVFAVEVALFGGAVGERPPRTILDQKWLLVLSGVVEANLKGNSNAAWLNETVSFIPGNSVSLGFGLNEGPLNYAINHYSIPRPSQNPKDYTTVFSVQNWAPFACLSAIFDEHQSIDA
jgi:hypothetical protein